MFCDYVDRGAVVNPTGVWARQGDRVLTHEEGRALSRRIARRLQMEGLNVGSRVAIYSPNDIVAMAAVTSLSRIGVVWVPLNPYSSQADIVEVLSATECEFLLSHASFAEATAEILARSPGIVGAAVFGDEDASFERWLAEADGLELRPPPSDDALVMMGPSGGTTGKPKIIPISGRQVLLMSWAFNAHMREQQPPVYLMAPPLTHAAGVSAFSVLAEGGSLVIQDGVKAPQLFDAIERHRISRMFLPPTAIYTLLNEPGVGSVDFGSLRHFIYAAAPMSADKLAAALEIFGPVMAQTYGQAEAPMICTYLSPEEHVAAASDSRLGHRLKSCGRESVVAAVRVMTEDGRMAEPDERGEIVVRGDLVMRAYYKNPEESAAVRRPGGWHGTGDIGYRDDDGYIYIVDRKKDMIITGGFNVYPNDVERVIWSIPQVTDCAVIGLPDPKWGEAVTAVIEIKPGESLSETDVMSACKAMLGSVKAPKSVLFRSLPRSPNGKVLKRVLRDEFWKGYERKI